MNHNLFIQSLERLGWTLHDKNTATHTDLNGITLITLIISSQDKKLPSNRAWAIQDQGFTACSGYNLNATHITEQAKAIAPGEDQRHVS